MAVLRGESLDCMFLGPHRHILAAFGGMTLILQMTRVQGSATLPSPKVFKASHDGIRERQGEQLAATSPF